MIENILGKGKKMLAISNFSFTNKVQKPLLLSSFNPFPSILFWDRPELKEAADDNWNEVIKGF